MDRIELYDKLKTNLEKKFLDDYNKHRKAVYECIEKIINCLQDQDILDPITRDMLLKRANSHDISKCENKDEYEGYIKMNREMSGIKYGTPEYMAIKSKYDYVIQLHFNANSHHPEYYKNGYADMLYLDKIEMICDWCGAIISRNNTDNIEESIKFNFKRFNIPEDEQEKIMDLVYFLFDKRTYIGSRSHIYDLIKINNRG